MLKKVLLKDIENLNIIGGQITSRIEAKLESNKIGEIKVLTLKQSKMEVVTIRI